MGADITPSDRAIVIAGPTASGKSALAIALAERFGGVVINADSMQVYRDLRILTARPSDADMARVPHRLFGHVDPAATYSVGRWLGEIGEVLAAAASDGRVAIIVGGTGLYIKALLQGISAIPNVPDEVRQRIRRAAEGRPAQALHAELAERDPVTAARLRTPDPQRIVRALEVFEATGTPLAVFQQRRGRPLLDPVKTDGLFLAPDRAELRLRIEARFNAMLAQGALAEVEALSRRGLDPALPALRALGCQPLMAYLNGKLPIAAAVNVSVTATAQYAKRQVTFARHQLPMLRWVDPRTMSTPSELFHRPT